MKPSRPPLGPDPVCVLWSRRRRAYLGMSGEYTRRMARIRRLTLSQAEVLRGQLSERVVIVPAQPGAVPTGTPTAAPKVARADLADLNEAELLRRAVRGLRGGDSPQAPRWCVVMDKLGLTSAGAVKLCRRLNLDPKERMGI